MKKVFLLAALLFAASHLGGCTVSDWIAAGAWYQAQRQRNNPQRYWSRYASENIRRDALCPSCRGSGIDFFGVRCRRCGGTGYQR